MAAGESFRLIVLNALAHLTANDDCARLNLHVEGVHQCRIALRRLRSAIKIYGPLLRRKRLAPVGEGIAWLGKVLGAARDLDVLQTDLLRPAIEAVGEAEQLAPLMTDVEAARVKAYEVVSEALASSRYRHLLIALCSLGHSGDFGKRGDRAPSLDQPLGEVASAALSRSHEKLLKRGKGFEGLSRAERHDVRIALKRLRYALDFFAGVFKNDDKKEFVKRLKRLQDDLGRMNDVAVAETMLARFADLGAGALDAAALSAQGQLAFSAGGILGWHRRRAAEMELHLLKDWEAFARARPFWLLRQGPAR
jgi:CHAD domain-containing protein